MVINLPRFADVLTSATKMTAAVMNNADPRPATNRNATKLVYSGITPIIRLPSPEMVAPRTRTVLAPCRPARIPDGILLNARATAKELTAIPIIAALNPKLLISSGMIGTIMPCPIVMKNVDRDNKRTLGSCLMGSTRL